VVRNALMRASTWPKMVYTRPTMPHCKFSFAFVAAVLCGAAAFGQSPTCDDTLWNHVYNLSRLVVQEQCVTVTGTMVDSTINEKIHHKDGVRHEEDGDTHGWLKLDPGQEKFVNDVNNQAEQGNLIFEIICKYPVTQADAKAACQAFKNTVKLPPVGSHVAITGSWVKDMDHNGWLEIHPVTSIVVIQE
jgi:hypothetical protein